MERPQRKVACKTLVGMASIFMMLLVMLTTGCNSIKEKKSPPVSDTSPNIIGISTSDHNMPTKAASARRDAPRDVLVGIGTAKLGTINQSRTIAATRARTEISNVMSNVIRNMVRDYTASSEVDVGAAVAYQEEITVSLSKSNLSGAEIWWEGEQDGSWWTVIRLSKGDVVREIGMAQAAARLKVPAMASFDAEKRMNEAFEQLFEEEKVLIQAVEY